MSRKMRFFFFIYGRNAQKFVWSVNSAVVPIFLIIFILTALCMLIISISEILEIINKDGKNNFANYLFLRTPEEI